MKVLVTGGAGFVGSHLVDGLVARGDEVIVVDHFKKRRRRFLNEQATYHKVGISDPRVKAIFDKEKPDAVCHLAAQISVTHSVDHPIFDASTNITDAIPLLQYASESGCKKFVFASSGGAIYGDHKKLPTPEVFDAQPISPYGVAKQTFEHYLQSFHELHGLPYTTLRFANLFGPRQLMHDQGEGSVIAIFLAKLLEGKQVTIFGDGSATRDFVFVKDAVDAFIRSLDGDFNGTVNISSGREISVLELWEILKEIHAEDHPMEHAEERPGEIKRSMLDGALAKKVLDWNPKTSFEDGLRETYDWFMKTFKRERQK